jgi:hypothetical protein
VGADGPGLRRSREVGGLSADVGAHVVRPSALRAQLHVSRPSLSRMRWSPRSGWFVALPVSAVRSQGSAGSGGCLVPGLSCDCEPSIF